MQTEFSKCGPELDRADIKNIERDLDVELPTSMRDHYLKCNGGMPMLDWFPGKDEWEPIRIHEFLFVATGAGAKPSIQSVFTQMVGKVGYPRSFVPFAIDSGANLFCVDVTTGRVHYWLASAFDERRTDAENRENADRLLTDSFEQFVSSLVSEDDAFN